MKGETNGRWNDNLKCLTPKQQNKKQHWRHKFFFNCIMATDKSFIAASKTFNIHYICQKSQCLTFHLLISDYSQYLSVFAVPALQLFVTFASTKQQYHIHFYYFTFQINSVKCIKLKGMLSSFINWLSPRKHHHHISISDKNSNQFPFFIWDWWIVIEYKWAVMIYF